MTKFESLRHLVYAMSRSEKKKFTLATSGRKTKPDYLILYEILVAEPNLQAEEARQRFKQKNPKAVFDSVVTYLFEVILDHALDLRIAQDKHYLLFKQILKARVLFEKSLYNECFGLLKTIMAQAEKLENYHALLFAGRLELEYLLALNFPNISEKQLLKKQFKLNESIKILRKVNEQSALFEILRHRLHTKGYSRSEEDKRYLNDLVYSEISIVASSSSENFEITKLHQLFQSDYLISVGDYKSALQSYLELSDLFEKNKHLLSTPPVYYLLTIEGVLESLRSIRNYSGMTYFIDKLKEITDSPVEFKTNTLCTIFLYELFPYLDQGNFSAASALMAEYKESLYSRMFSLNPSRQAELCLYTALIYFGNADYHKAYSFLSQIIIRGKTYYFLPLYRTIRLVSLMILYHLSDYELIGYQCRSIRRELAGEDKAYKLERFLLLFLQKQVSLQRDKREELWHKYESQLENIRKDIFEQQVLRIFDFTAWVEAMMTNMPLSTILELNNKRYR